MTAAIITICMVIGLIWAATKIQPMVTKTFANEAQAVFLTEYLNYSMSPACTWINDCKNKEEIVLKGQDKLWETIAAFNDNMTVLAQNDFKFKAGNTEMLDQALEILSTVHLMHAAEKGDITFHKIKADKEENEPPVQDGA